MAKDAQVWEASESTVTLLTRSVRTQRRLSPAAMPGYHKGRRPANAGKRYRIELLLPGEVLRLIETCSSDSLIGARNRARYPQ
jgi:hypothetical protein